MSKIKEVSTIIKPSEFFKRLDLSKLDANTAQYVREEILSFDNTDLLDGTPEFDAVRKMIEENYPQALGIIPVPDKVIDETKKIEPVKKTVTGKVNKKEQERLKKEEQKAAKEKHKQEIEEIEGLIELMDDTVKANPKDEDSKDYLELLQDTIKELKKKKFEEGGEVDDNDDVKLEHIGSLIKDGNTSGYDPFWKLDIQFDGDIDDSDREHISKLVSEGYTSGEIVSGEESQRGWWSIEIGMEKGGKIPFKHRFIFEPKRRPDVIITGDIVEKIGATGIKTTHVTVNGYYYKTINPLSRKPYRTLFVRKHYGILYHEKFATFKEASDYLRTQSKHILSEIDKAERLEKSEIKYVNGGGIETFMNNKGEEIPNNYEGKSDEQIWTEWTADQRIHFLLDHPDSLSIILSKDKSLYPSSASLALSKLNYSELPKEVKDEINIHKEFGEYATGGDIKNLLPPIMEYSKNLQLAVRKFGITIDEARDKYGKYTIGQWNDLLNDSTSEYNGKYAYKLHEERGFISAYVEDMTTQKVVWEFNYPDQSLSEADREFQSTPISDGFIRHWQDVSGLENYLKDLGAIPADAQLLSEDEFNKIGYYGVGGAVNNEIGAGTRIMFTHEGVPHKGEVEEVTNSGKYIVGYLDKLGQVLVEKNEVVSIVPKEDKKRFSLFNDGGGIKKWYEQGGEISDDIYYKVVKRFVNFSLNYPKNLFDAFGEKDNNIRKHIEEKFDKGYDKHGSYGAMIYFWTELDNTNRRLLADWINDNHDDVNTYSEKVNSRIIINHFVYFCLNYPKNFMDAFVSHKEHLQSKFDNAYEKHGSYGAMVKFWTELDSENQKLLSDWAKENYKGEPLTYNSGGDVVSEPKSGSDKIESKYKQGDTVRYTPKLSGFDNNTPLVIKYVNYKDGSEFGDTKGYYYGFDGMNLSSHEDNIEEYKKGGAVEEKRNEKVYHAMLQEAKKDKKWAEKTKKDKKWLKSASDMSKEMLNEFLDKSVEELADNSYKYLRYRSHAMSGGVGSFHIDKPAKEKWEKLSGETIEFKKGGAVAEATDTFVIGDILQNKKHKHIFVTVVINDRHDFQVLTAYDSDKDGKGIAEGNWVRAIWDYDFNEWNKVGHIDLQKVEKEYKGEKYSYYKSDNADIDTYLAHFDDRYKFFVANAPKALKNKRDEMENDNYHFGTAKLIDQFFNNPENKKISDYKFEKGGKIEKDFIKKVKSIHSQMRQVILKDGTKVDAKDLMAKGGAIKNKDRVEIVLKHYLIAALWSSTDSENDDTPFDSNYNVDDFDSENVTKIRKLIIKFLMDNKSDLKASGLDDEQIGHDLWLTQVGHDAGFWDREGVSKKIGEKLSKAAKKLGQSASVYAQDGKVAIDGLGNVDEMKRGGDVKSKPEHYRYLTLQKIKGGLELSLNKEGIEEVKDLKSDSKSDTDIWFNLFEDVHGNSEYIFHSDMGESGLGMTSAEGITDGYHYEGEDRFNLYKTDYPKTAKVYWFPNYMVESSLDTMIKDGKVFFTEAESMKLGGQTKAGIAQDKNIKALHAGKRKSADGNVYYENRPNRSDKNRTKKFNEGGNMEGWTDIKDIVPAKLKVEKTTAFGNPEYLNVMYNGKRIARFYYNMKGYNQDFSLKNKEGVHFGFGGDKSESRQFSDFKSALREGFTLIK